LSSEVSEGHGRLGSSEPLVDWAQQSVHHLSSVSFSWDRLDRTEDLRTHDTPHSSISLQHVFPPASNPHSPTNSATREQRTLLITATSHGCLSVDSRAFSCVTVECTPRLKRPGALHVDASPIHGVNPRGSTIPYQ